MPPHKKAPKKKAEKAEDHHHKKHHEADDLRRAYEHMGRVKALRTSLKSSAAEAVDALAALAQAEMESGHNKEAADILRAAEHLSFATLGVDSPSDGDVSVLLEQAITERFDELARKADEHWEENGQQSRVLTAIYKSSRKSAVRAFKESAYDQALEFARAAEALTRVDHKDGQSRLESKAKKLQLKSA
jgi:hypothetical protein